MPRIVAFGRRTSYDCDFESEYQYGTLRSSTLQAMASGRQIPDEIALSKRQVSLGWLSESSIMPKKRRAIDGVGASSAVELRAQLYKSQEERKRIEEGGLDSASRKVKRGDVVHLLTQKNNGVDERANRDKLYLKQIENGSSSYEALEKKAELYEKLMKGELPDGEDAEKYSVDFLRKGYLEEEKEEMERENTGSPPAGSTENEQRTLNPVFEESFDTHKVLVREVHEETMEARHKSEILKRKRQQQADKNRERLKQAFLQKQKEKLIAKQKQKPGVEK